MTTVFVKGKARTETPRIKNLPACLESVRDPSVGRTAHGHFGPRNPHAIGQGFKAMVRRSLGDPKDPAVGELVKEALRFYLASLRSLPSDDPQVRPLVAAQARHAVLATHLTNLAVRAGLDTDKGLRLAEAARAHDMTAQRLSVTAFDRAVRIAAACPRSGPDAIDRLRTTALARMKRDEAAASSAKDSTDAR